MGSSPIRVSRINLINIIAGWSSLVARRAHNPKVVGSNPAPAIMVRWSSWLGRLPVTQEITSSSLVRTVSHRKTPDYLLDNRGFLYTIKNDPTQQDALDRSLILNGVGIHCR